MAARYATRSDVCGAHGAPGGVAPEFNGVPDATLDIWIGVAKDMIGLHRFGKRASDAHALLVAHLLSVTVGDSEGAGSLEAGPITSEANGPASRSFATPGLDDSQLALSGYGRTFMTVRNIVRGRTTGVVGVSTARQRK